MSSKLDYLRRYLGGDAGGDGAGDGEKKKKRKRKKERDGAPSGGGSDGAAPRAKKLGTGITVHDDDVDDWKYAAEREAERRAREEEGPVVVGGDDPGVSKGRARQYLGIREDGSGWAVADGDGDGDANGDDDLSPPRPGRHDSDDDLSPPRPGRHDSDDEEADLSPPRRRMHDSDDEAAGDLSPPRRGGAQSPSPDLSPPRRRARSPSNEDLSPPRKRAPTMTDGTATGLVDAATVVREAEEKRAAAKARMERLGDDASGRFAATAVRDKATGRILTAEEVAAREAAKDAAKKPKERERPIWATGVAQAKQIAEGRAALAEESTNPFARSDIDARADAAMREAERFGDPMAYLARRRERQGGGDIVLPSVVEGISEEALKKSGFRIPQEVPAHSWMRRGIGAAPNRYGIRPGRHWDGVDRSTGFEQELFKTQNQVRARDHSAWKMAQAMWE
jgi:pre-mRNA-splicing factor CWC26